MTKSKTFEFEATTSNVRYYCSKKVFKTHVTKQKKKLTRKRNQREILLKTVDPVLLKVFFLRLFENGWKKKHTVRNKLAKGILTVSNE